MRQHQPARIVQTGPDGRVGPARYHDTETGADLVTTGRDSLTYSLDGREVVIPVEYGRHGTIAVYGVMESWSDGAPVTVDERRSLRETLLLVAERQHWTLDMVYDLVTGEHL